MGIDSINLPKKIFERNWKGLKRYKLSPILYIYSNRALEKGLPGFQYGRPLKNQSLLPDEKNHNDIPIVSLDFISVPCIVSNFSSIPRGSGHKLISPAGVYYYHKFFGSVVAELFLDLSVKTHPRLIVNRTYSLWSNLRSTFYDLPGRILSDLTTITLGEAGHIPLHCAAISRGDSAVLIWAPPDTGKTTTVWKLVSQKIFNFMSEDITLTDGLRSFACPYTTSGLPRELNYKGRLCYKY